MFGNKKKKEYKKATEAASIFAIIADPTRCRIIKLLVDAEKSGQCVYEVAETIGLTHSAASHQLNKMEALKIVECVRVGQSMCYSLTDSEFTKKLVQALEIFYK